MAFNQRIIAINYFFDYVAVEMGYGDFNAFVCARNSDA